MDEQIDDLVYALGIYPIIGVSHGKPFKSLTVCKFESLSSRLYKQIC